MRHAAAVPAIGLLAGSALALSVPGLPRVPEVVLLIVGAAVGVWAWRADRPPVLAAAACAAFAGGAAPLADHAWQEAWNPPLRAAFESLARAERDAAAAEQRALPEDDRAPAVVEGVLRSDASPGESGVSLSLDVTAVSLPHEAGARGGMTRTSGGVLLTVGGTLATAHVGDWRAGRRIRAPADLRRPSRYLDPGVPDFERALARRGAILVGVVKSGALVEVLARGSLLDEAMASARAFARRAIGDAVGRWSPRSAAIVAAIVIGDRAGLDADVQRQLQDAGTYHVIAISGGNIAILAGVLVGAFRLLGLLGRTAMLLAIALLAAYAVFVGGGASVDRATLMTAAYFAGRAIDQRGAPLNGLALVAACLVLASPLAVADPAFLLTFGATLAILLAAPAVTWRPRAAAALLVASLAAEAMLFPVGALVFGRITAAGLVLNFLAIPLMAVAQIAGMAVVPLFALSPTLDRVAGWAAHAGAGGLVWSAGLVRFAPAVVWRTAAPSVAAAVLYYCALVAWWRLSRRRAMVTGTDESVTARRARQIAAAVALAAALWILIDPVRLASARGDGRLHVVFIDVGQGDSALVAFPHGATMLVDAGGSSGSFDIGERVVAPVLRDRGVRRLDVLVLTHGDPDHVGGAPAIVREFRPRQVWEGIPVPRAEPMTRLRETAQASGADWRNVRRGDHVEIDGVEVTARHPDAPDWERQRVRNDDSVVLELLWRGVSIVLTGDIQAEGEHDTARDLRPAPLRVLKVAHHGSATSSTPAFVAAASPRAAIVSVGRANRFGHPAPLVLERYAAAGIEVFRTDRDGAVTLDTDGETVKVGAYTGRRWVNASPDHGRR